MPNIKIKTTFKGGLFGKGGVERYKERLLKAKTLAYKQSFNEAKLETRKALTQQAKGVFNVKSKTFSQMFTGSKYDQKKDKMPTALFYSRSHYWNIFEQGANIGPKKAKGLFIPFIAQNNRNKDLSKGIAGAKTDFFKLLAKLKSQGKTYWKMVNGKLILFAVIDKDNRKGLNKYRRKYAKDNGLKSVKSGTAIPVGVFMKSVKIKRRFNFTIIAKTTFVPKMVKSFNEKIDLSKI